MFSPASRPVRLAFVTGGAEPGGELRDALEATAEFEVVASHDDVEAAAADGEAAADCLLCLDGREMYDSVRDAYPEVPVVVLTDAVDDDFLRTVVADEAAEFVRRDATAPTLLPDRTRQLLSRVTSEGPAWELADLAEKAIVQFDLDTFEVLAANEPFTTQWGFDEETVDGLTLSDLRETDITSELRGQGRGAAGEEHLEWITEGGAVENFVLNALNGDFEVREWHCTDADGEGFKSEVQVVVDPTSAVGYLVATVPSKSGEETEYDEASMLQSVMEHVPMSVYFEERNGRHVLVSEDLVEPFIEGPDGKIMHTPGDVHGKTYFDLYPPDVAEQATEDNRQIMETGEPLRGQEEHVQPPHGEDLWFSTSKAPWYDSEGRIQGIVGITVDITEQKRRERELNRQNERLDEFASIVSHDLRNPLNVAEGQLELYRETGDQTKLEAVSEMHERIDTLIDDVLTFAREGSHIEHKEYLSGRPQASEAWATVDTGAATLEQSWDYCIQADPDRLIRIFENLFRNAVEHGATSPASRAQQDAAEHGSTDDADAEEPEAGLSIEVGTLAEEGGFYVQDDGSGIPDEVRETAFERGVTTGDGGTGFGLAIVREIADAHGWDVSLADVSGGTRFEFTGVARGDDPS